MFKQATHFPRRAVEIYREGGLGQFYAECRTHVRWRWNRLRIHPTFRKPYTKSLQVRRAIIPDRFTDADYFKILYVDPARIEKRAINLPRTWGRVIGGTWETQSFTDNAFYQALEQRHIKKKSWSEIEHNLNNTEKWDNLYNKIQEEGFRSQQELRRENAQSDLFTTDCEVGVGIDNNGELVWIAGGFHRLSIAKLLELPEIPVQVRVRHPAWQAIRNEINEAESASELSERTLTQLSHPDLADVRGSIEIRTS